MQAFIIQAVNGLSFSALLFLLSAGFTLIFGLMRVINLAHGSFFLAGAYLGFTTMATTGNFVLALLVGGISLALLGLLEERVLLRHFRGKEMDQVLLTLALWFILDNLAIGIWGGSPVRVNPPDLLIGPVQVLGIWFPKYRVVLIGVGLLVAIGMGLLIEKTKLGAIIRAGVDNQEIARALGIDVDRTFLFAFGLGASLAGIAGVLASPVFGVDQGLSGTVLSLAMVVVIVGGLGSIKGAFVGSLFVGLVDNFGRAYFPEFSYFTLFVPMALILALRPQGLFGRA